MVTKAGLRRVGAQREGLLQAGAVSAGEGQRLTTQAAFSSTTREIFLAQRGRQAAGIARPAGVEPGATGLAGERRGLAVPGRQAAVRLV